MGKQNNVLTFVVLLLSSSGPNLNAFTATFPPFQSRFQRSVYPRVAKGISCILKSWLIRQAVGNLPNVRHNDRSTVNAVLLRSAGMSGCWRICRGLISLRLPRYLGYGARGNAYRRFYQLDKLEGYFLSKWSGSMFSFPLIAQELFCQMRKLVRGRI